MGNTMKYEYGVEPFKNVKSDSKVLKKIAKLKDKLSDKIIILGHHYERDDVIQFADIRGDSFKLSQKAAKSKDREFIIFCGVEFMAESADIISSDFQKVIIPDMEAGCPLADFASLPDVEKVWKEINSIVEQKIIPITYINSTAELKSFVGINGGSVCTSSNASKIFDWAMERGEKIFFFPDQFLGGNTAFAKGIDKEKIILWQRNKKLGGNSKEDIINAKIILWDGYCSVHKRFKLEDIQRLRKKYPKIKIISHPECNFEVIKNSDQAGSTGQIIQAIENSPDGSIWGVGTEQHLVNRLQEMHPKKKILSLSKIGNQCVTMSKNTPEKLLTVLENLDNGKIINQVIVKDEIKKYAKISLERMINITANS
ncbi:MAG: quinolinate synthase NadA [Candidatus Marinimicrobia bacterium]|nr:quinolinate synthase NadA [Candidatus Neomarinimicrobiota bacterium]